MRTVIVLATAALLTSSCKRGPAEDPRFAAAWKQLMARGDEVLVVGDEAAGAALLDSIHRSGRHHRRPDAQAPAAVPSPATAAAAQVPDQDLMRVIRTGLGGLKQCYRLCEASTSDGGGKAIVHFTILPTGSVQAVSVDAPSFSESRLPSCVSMQVRGWRFPTFDGQPMEVAYPFVFVGS